MAGQKKEFEMKQVFALWLKKSKAGAAYLSGVLADAEGAVYVKGFINGKKKNPKEPDIRVYQDVEGEKFTDDYLITSLWCNVSKNGEKYFTGKMMYEGKEIKLVGFINNKACAGSKIPYITLYESSGDPKKQEEKKYTSGKGAPKKLGGKVASAKPTPDGFVNIPDGAAEELPF